eukprot:TRINITY_DN23553_c0_g1_i1.p1 TRINITY_DN23553_c0_g1~~TRINITY_DN23553_c0_g1_i1.p1  ORF type:complete len:1416 (+),score=259.34 TRINITY_DN23553_c0_g1_i1:225-4472(+)
MAGSSLDSGLKLERSEGHAVKVPLEKDAFLSPGTISQLLDPKNLNAGVLQDIYQQRDDDFEQPQTLEVSYQQNGMQQQEIVFVDGLYADERPRICVSLRSVHAMHRAIAVLSRKLDNMHQVLRTCRSHYYKELVHLRHLIGQNSYSGLPEDHAAYFFQDGKYQDEMTLSMWKEQLDKITGELESQIQAKTVENMKLQRALDKAKLGHFDDGDPGNESIHSLYRDQIQRIEDARHKEVAELRQEISEANERLSDAETRARSLQESWEMTNERMQEELKEERSRANDNENQMAAMEKQHIGERRHFAQERVEVEKQKARETEEKCTAQAEQAKLQVQVAAGLEERKQLLSQLESLSELVQDHERKVVFLNEVLKNNKNSEKKVVELENKNKILTAELESVLGERNHILERQKALVLESDTLVEITKERDALLEGKEQLQTELQELHKWNEELLLRTSELRQEGAKKLCKSQGAQARVATSEVETLTTETLLDPTNLENQEQEWQRRLANVERDWQQKVNHLEETHRGQLELMSHESETQQRTMIDMQGQLMLMRHESEAQRKIITDLECSQSKKGQMATERVSEDSLRSVEDQAFPGESLNVQNECNKHGPEKTSSNAFLHEQLIPIAGPTRATTTVDVALSTNSVHVLGALSGSAVLPDYDSGGKANANQDPWRAAEPEDAIELLLGMGWEMQQHAQAILADMIAETRNSIQEARNVGSPGGTDHALAAQGKPSSCSSSPQNSYPEHAIAQYESHSDSLPSNKLENAGGADENGQVPRPRTNTPLWKVDGQDSEMARFVELHSDSLPSRDMENAEDAAEDLLRSEMPLRAAFGQGCEIEEFVLDGSVIAPTESNASLQAWDGRGQAQALGMQAKPSHQGEQHETQKGKKTVKGPAKHVHLKANTGNTSGTGYAEHGSVLQEQAIVLQAAQQDEPQDESSRAESGQDDEGILLGDWAGWGQACQTPSKPATASTALPPSEEPGRCSSVASTALAATRGDSAPCSFGGTDSESGLGPIKSTPRPRTVHNYTDYSRQRRRAKMVESSQQTAISVTGPSARFQLELPGNTELMLNIEQELKELCAQFSGIHSEGHRLLDTSEGFDVLKPSTLLSPAASMHDRSTEVPEQSCDELQHIDSVSWGSERDSQIPDSTRHAKHSRVPIDVRRNVGPAKPNPLLHKRASQVLAALKTQRLMGRDGNACSLNSKVRSQLDELKSAPVSTPPHDRNPQSARPPCSKDDSRRVQRNSFTSFRSVTPGSDASMDLLLVEQMGKESQVASKILVDIQSTVPRTLAEQVGKENQVASKLTAEIQSAVPRSAASQGVRNDSGFQCHMPVATHSHSNLFEACSSIRHPPSSDSLSFSSNTTYSARSPRKLAGIGQSRKVALLRGDGTPDDTWFPTTAQGGLSGPHSFRTFLRK